MVASAPMTRVRWDPRAAGFGLLLGALAAVLAVRHPLGSAGALTVIAAVGVAAFRWPLLALAAPVALLPVAGLAPWTGWLLVEEFDLLLLASMAGGWAALAMGRAGAPQPQRAPTRGWARWVLPLLLATWAVALWRGLGDAGGLSWGWWQGYRDPLNSVRLAKPLPAAILWWCLWRAMLRRDADGAHMALQRGAAMALALAGMVVVWERAAFPGLLNFSSDYRTTAMFWEMHVGGAALDGFLALALPLAAHHAWHARNRWESSVALAGLALAGYVALTTFSRIVYLAVPAGLAVMLLLHARAPSAGATTSRSFWAAAGAAVVLFAAGAAWLFPGSGHRGLLAWLGCWLVWVPLAAWAPALPRAGWAAGVAMGLPLAALAAGAAMLLPKGPYLVHAMSVAATVTLLWRLPQAGQDGHPRRPDAARTLPWVAAGAMCCASSALHVAWHWGGEPGLQRALLPIGSLAALLAVLAFSRREPSPIPLRWQGMLMAALLAVAGLVAVFSGGAYMGERMAGTRGDLDGRTQHWQRSLAMLRDDAAHWLGLGSGRYVEHYAMAAHDDRPGDYRLAQEPGNQYLVLAGGRHVQGWGEILRVSQRLAIPHGSLQVRLRVRAYAPTVLHVDVCRKHLLYDAGCQVGSLRVADTAGQWQSHAIVLKGAPLPTVGLPVPAVFSVGLESPGVSAQIDDVALVDSNGQDQLRNGHFEQGLARWLFSSDRHHMPWHAKNMAVHLWVEQGLLGLAAFGTAVLLALLRLGVGPGRGHPLAPALAGGIVGLLIVGSVDSLLDMPRVAWLVLVWCLVALDLRATSPSRPAVSPERSAARG